MIRPVSDPESLHNCPFLRVDWASLKQIVVWLPVENCVLVSKTSNWLCVLSVVLSVWQCDGDIKKKQVGTSCVKQSDTPKYVIHVLGGVVSNKYRQQH